MHYFSLTFWQLKTLATNKEITVQLSLCWDDKVPDVSPNARLLPVRCLPIVAFAFHDWLKPSKINVSVQEEILILLISRHINNSLILSIREWKQKWFQFMLHLQKHQVLWNVMACHSKFRKKYKIFRFNWSLFSLLILLW